jgi:hypothetical protein
LICLAGKVSEWSTSSLEQSKHAGGRRSGMKCMEWVWVRFHLDGSSS